jgi:plasmid stabilization system protein ParE
MEEGFPCKPYIVSREFNESRKHIYEYSVKTFGYFQAERYMQKIRNALDALPVYYHVYPECRHIPTKSRKYRNIIFKSHLIIYRITAARIEVLDIVPARSNTDKIRNVRKIRL